ncbi:hypothetical protein LCM20_09410 [Halobacillus litoralis]|uniref:hypothetical protein n=1 Tax=Halobacillus litoralis TaxID=45668 RepID=UPI001CD5965D|nr:hypothetical protein [Halobacillus litoralis]MCA0970806.1 hypothetical protein [Halobacillus litoralis]
MTLNKYSKTSILFLLAAALMYFLGYNLFTPEHHGLNFYIAGALAFIAVLFICVSYRIHHNGSWGKTILLLVGLTVLLLVINALIIFVGLILLPSLFG